MLTSPTHNAALRRKDSGVTLIATLVILIVYAGFAAVLQAKASARFNVSSEVSAHYQNQLDEASARAGLLPEIAEALLVAREGRPTELNLAGEENFVEHDGQMYILILEPAERAHSWFLSVALAN
ncbi:hypothetical protein [Octadecabacter ascidiaceicola]|uniref:hypothetical protein n=1 Tax=Octadecabacter ascidiaceicola TaxID=1655543 RepID=UPI0015C5B270|nr:hypothetical protein [Octadecabacter ascidiaceicola]